MLDALTTSQLDVVAIWLRPRGRVDIVDRRSLERTRTMANMQLTTAPDLIGRAKAESINILTNGGLAVGAVTEAASDTVPVGHVISSSPIAGVNVAPAAPVDIVVSRGPADITVPDVAG